MSWAYKALRLTRAFHGFSKQAHDNESSDGQNNSVAKSLSSMFANLQGKKWRLFSQFTCHV